MNATIADDLKAHLADKPFVKYVFRPKDEINMKISLGLRVKGENFLKKNAR